MSIEKLASGYNVRWRDSAGRSRKKKVQLWRDAVTLDGEKKRQRAMGELIAHERGQETLNNFYRLWYGQHGCVHCTPRTLAMYERHWRRHVSPALGYRPLNELTPEHIARFVAKLSATLAPGSVARIMGILRGVLERAVEWRYIAANPARSARLPQVIARRGRALTPEQLDALCAELSARGAAIARVLAGTGLRPGELRALTWLDFSLRSIQVERAASGDVIAPTKTRKSRTVELTIEARSVLLEWFVRQGQPRPTSLVFPNRDGGIWRDVSYNNWQQLKWNPAAARAGLKGVVPYDLRHTFASRLIAEGRSVIEVARQLGHSPTLTLTTYAHEFEDRGELVPSECPDKLDTRQILSYRG